MCTLHLSRKSFGTKACSTLSPLRSHTLSAWHYFITGVLKLEDERAHAHTACAEKRSHQPFVRSLVVDYSVHNNSDSNKHSLNTVSFIKLFIRVNVIFK